MKLKDLNELLAVLPTLRRLRTMSAEFLRVALGRENGECTWCGGELKGRQRCWCSKQCVHEFRLRTDNGYQILHVIEREKGICQRCGVNAVEAKAAWERDRRRNGPVPEAEIKERLTAAGFGRGKWYEVDHTTPVCEGGGLCSVDDLRLLCGRCHNDVTNELTKRNLTRKKKPQRPRWINHQCSKCEGFLMEVKGYDDRTVTLTCQLCSHRKHISSADFDVIVGGAK